MSKSKRTRHVHRWGKWRMSGGGPIRECRNKDAFGQDCQEIQTLDIRAQERILNAPRPKVRYRKVGWVTPIVKGSENNYFKGVVSGNFHGNEELFTRERIPRRKR